MFVKLHELLVGPDLTRVCCVHGTFLTIHAMNNIDRCHKNALHIAVLCPQTRSLNRMFQELHDGNEWELLGHRKSKGKSQAVSLEGKNDG